MTTPAWQPGYLYVPGAVVKRVSSPPAVATTPTNPGFESGDSGWTKDAGWGITTSGQRFAGAWSAEFNATATNRRIVNTYLAVIAPGQIINASCQVNQGPSAAGVAGARVEIDWLDASDVLLSTDQGNLVDSASNNNWLQSSVTATAPAGAAKARIAASAFRNSGSGKVWVDSFLWNYAFIPSLDSLVFTAVQTEPGLSGSAEPVWPLTNGLTVVDNEVTWEATTASRVVWEATPIMTSGTVEPTWPTQVGQTVSDNNQIIWTAISRQITDENCPNSKVVAIAASKIFAGDDDIIRYCATVNPLDWTTRDDAGYLPFGLQTYGANPVAALGLYRSNLIALNSQGFQMWQVDQDPANNAFLDAVPVGSTYTHTWRPIANDLIGLNPVGIRNLSIAGASTNLQADGVGEPIDVLVKAKIRLLDRDDDPIGLLWPATGQYWLIFGDEAFVLTINGAKKKSWSRYVFPEEITDWTLDGNTLVLRTETGKVWELDEDALYDDMHSSDSTTVYTGSTTWTKPPGLTSVDVYVLGGGGGGGSGRRGYTGPSLGGGGGGGGGYSVASFTAAELGATEAITVGAGGAGGAASTTATNFVEDGHTGSTGGTSSFGSHISAAGGVGGTGGNNSAILAAAGGVGNVANGGAGGLYGQTAGSNSVLPTSSTKGGGGGGGGGSRDNSWEDTDFAQAGAAGNTSVESNAGGAKGGQRVNGTAGTASADGLGGGGGGGGGGSNTWDSQAGVGNGGNGATPGGGGGGGGTGQSQRSDAGGTPQFSYQQSGAGGNGGVGSVIVVEHYEEALEGTDIEGIVWWPFLDMGAIGVEKGLVGLDLVATAPEGVAVSIGYNQNDNTQRTPNYEIDADTLAGQLVPFPVSGPSFDLKLTFEPGQAWEWQATNMYVQDWRKGR
jgi:hypothetical protein